MTRKSITILCHFRRFKKLKMTNFECCKSKSFPSSYFICVNCFKIFHRCCTLKQKSNYEFIEGFKIRCCNDDNSAKLTDDEKTFLEETISELTENSQSREKHITKLKKDHEKFIEEATQREEELDNLLKEQHIFIEKANNEIMSLKQELQKFTNKLTSTKSSQTQQITVMDKQIQTIDEIITCNIRRNQTIPKTAFEQSAHVETIENRQILLIAGNHGKDLVHILKSRLNTWSVSSILKPNASSSELAKTAIKASKHLSRKDYIILWPNENVTFSFKHLHTSLKHTNFFILTSPLHPTNRYFNDRVYHDNISLYKEAHNLTGGLKNLIDINSALKAKNYSRCGKYINKIGKRFVGLEIVKRVLSESRTNSINKGDKAAIKENTNHRMDTSSQQSTERYDKITTCNEPSQPHFLYPRLSQEMFPEM